MCNKNAVDGKFPPTIQASSREPPVIRGPCDGSDLPSRFANADRLREFPLLVVIVNPPPGEQPVRAQRKKSWSWLVVILVEIVMDNLDSLVEWGHRVYSLLFGYQYPGLGANTPGQDAI